MFTWHLGNGAQDKDKAAASDADKAESDKDKATALLLAAARQLVVGRGWTPVAAIRTY